MDQTLHALGGIVLNGLPTFFLIIILAFCVKYLYLKPLDKVLAQRYSLTEGARKAAEESLRNADTRVAEFENALAQARSEIYRDQNVLLKQIRAEQAEKAQAARAESDARVAAAKAGIAAEAQTAREGLQAQSESLANQIADSLLAKRAA